MMFFPHQDDRGGWSAERYGKTGDGGDEFDEIGGEGTVDGIFERKDGGQSVDQK